MAESSVQSKQSLPRPSIRRFRAFREVLDIAVLIIVVYALVNLSTARFIVQGPSMEPTFFSDQYLIVSRVNYMLGSPQHGDIVVFHYPGDPNEDYIKRVIGVPGDMVEIRDTLVYVNGELLEEPYINESCSRVRCQDQTVTLVEDQYFVMGDNRNHSKDSREFGPVDRRFIVGEVMVRYWPPSDWAILGQFN